MAASERAGGGRVAGMVPLTLRIKRFNPEVRADPWWDEFTIDVDPTDRLLDALHVVKWYRDGTLALRRACAHGICGSDGMLINGRNALAWFRPQWPAQMLRLTERRYEVA